MVRKVLGLTVFMALLVAVGCGGGYSDEKAKQRCDEEKLIKTCMTDAAYDQCLTCYQECGADCEISAGCPDTYECR